MLAAPLAGLAIGVWAEFANLSPLMLFAVAGPAILLATISAAYLARTLARPIALILSGAALGVLTFGLAEGSYVAIHLSRGGFLNFERFDTQGEMAAALIGIHLAVGAMVGAALGAGAATFVLVAKALTKRSSVSPRSA